jgi:hypothetical protein
MNSKKKKNSVTDPIHNNLLTSLKHNQSNVVDIDTLELNDKILVIVGETDSKFVTYYIELKNDESPEIHHVNTKLEGA